MTKKNEKVVEVLKNPWAITVLGGVIVFLLTSELNSIMQNVNYIEGAKNVIMFIISVLKNVLTFKVSIWIILLFLCGLIFVIYIISEWKHTEPQWINYKSDYFFDWLFVWEYSKYLKTIEIARLRPVCSHCRCDTNFLYKSHKKPFKKARNMV